MARHGCGGDRLERVSGWRKLDLFMVSPLTVSLTLAVKRILPSALGQSYWYGRLFRSDNGEVGAGSASISGTRPGPEGYNGGGLWHSWRGSHAVSYCRGNGSGIEQ